MVTTVLGLLSLMLLLSLTVLFIKFDIVAIDKRRVFMNSRGRWWSFLIDWIL